MNYRAKVMSDRSRRAPMIGDVTDLARNACAHLRRVGMLVAKESVLEVLENVKRGSHPPGDYFETLSRSPEDYRRALVDMLAEVMLALELDTDIPWAEEIP